MSGTGGVNPQRVGGAGGARHGAGGPGGAGAVRSSGGAGAAPSAEALMKMSNAARKSCRCLPASRSSS